MTDTKLLTIKAVSTEKGVRLYFQSAFFENFFSNYHTSMGYDKGELSNTRSWGKDNYGYMPPNDKLFNSFRHWGGRLYEKTRPNLSFLCAKGLEKGITFNLPNIIMNENILEKYIADLKKELAKVYKEYFSTLSYEENFYLDD